MAVGSSCEVDQAYSEPMTVRVVDHDVVIIGPDSIGVSLTPEAAEESARRLLEAAGRARVGEPRDEVG